MSGIESIMNREVVVIGKEEAIRDAAHHMRSHGLGALVVVEEDRIYGLLSERDIVYRVIAAGLDPAVTKVAEVCTVDPITVLGTESVERCFRLLREQGFRHLPVRDDAHRPVGIVSSRDFMWGLLMTTESEFDIEEVCRKLGQLGNVLDTAQERYPA